MTTVLILGGGLLAALVLIPVLIITMSEDDDQLIGGCGPGAGGSVTIPDEYRAAVEAAAQESGFSPSLIAAQIEQESGWDPNAQSGAGAQGIAQFMPGTWAEYGQGSPLDPLASIEAMGRYLAALQPLVADLATTDQERIELTLAAYNAGPGPVQNHGGVPPFLETQNYVQTIVAAAGIGANDACSQLGNMNVAGAGVDDYPYREPVGVAGWGMQRTIFGHTQRQCTDFVMWRINQAMGWDFGQGEPPVTFSALGVGYGPGQSGAGSWRDILTQAPGVTFHTSDPQPGDIAWWGYNDIGGGYGHVGFVAEVNGTTATIEHYNLTPNAYSVTETPVNNVPGYIRLTGE